MLGLSAKFKLKRLFIGFLVNLLLIAKYNSVAN